MSRLTKSEIANLLLSGEPAKWKDANEKECRITLENSKQRRLFRYLLSSKIREPKNLPDSFVTELNATFDAGDDPIQKESGPADNGSSSGPWRLHSIETEGFGGLNIWSGPPFRFEFDQESLLLEGPNGSGKSSLVGAILWALSGERPRDQAHARAHEFEPVFGINDKEIGKWPPIACYPPSKAELTSAPNVRVTLTFQSPSGTSAEIERTLCGDEVKESKDPALRIPMILLETGILMPARLTQIRLNEGKGRLTDAVQKLTGLDELAEIGLLVEGLCHKGREYLSYASKQNFEDKKKEFGEKLESAKTTLSPVNITVPSFVPKDAEDPTGNMTKFVKDLNDKTAKLTKIIANDLAPNLNLSDSTIHQKLIGAISEAQTDLSSGLEGLDTWKTLGLIVDGLDTETTNRLTAAIEKANQDVKEAIEFEKRNTTDSKFQLKAVGAHWHAEHIDGPVKNCPMCNQSLEKIPELSDELDGLATAGEAASRTFKVNMNVISSTLEDVVPTSIKKILPELLTLIPREALLEDIRKRFIETFRYKTYLVGFGSIVQEALSKAPNGDLPLIITSPTEEPTEGSSTTFELISRLEWLLTLNAWFKTKRNDWISWWNGLVVDKAIKEKEERDDKIGDREGLTAHLNRLLEALGSAEPYRIAAGEMQKALILGNKVAEIGKEKERREEIAEALSPLKSLGALTESVARQAIDDLSGRISTILDQTYLTDRLRFTKAQLSKKEGVVVRGMFDPELRIDATLVANTSWLRAVLWAFLFSLREEAVEQLGRDFFPFLVFDDPQATFDIHHRHRWAQQVAGLQNSSPKVQVLLTTYDEIFLHLIQVDGIGGRHALIAAAGPEIGHVGIFEGTELDRKWIKAKTENTPTAGRNYLIAARIYVEGILKLLLRGEDPGVSSFVIGASRTKIEKMLKAGDAPYNKEGFKSLLGHLNKSLSPIKYIEMAHHTTGSHLGMSEANEFECHWRKKLSPALEKGFRLKMEHQVLHGGLAALHSSPPELALPEGYQEKIKTLPLTIFGKAAALTEGRSADGRLAMDLDLSAHDTIVLGRHYAFRLTVPTLEPVARPGDILLVREFGEPSSKSLVVGLSEERLLARRFEIADNHSDVAVLTAQAINPRQIAPPVIAKVATLKLHEIIGVLFSNFLGISPAQPGMEVCDCGGEAVISQLLKDAFLIEVIGESAEPRALDNQYLIVKKEVPTEEALNKLDGKPIIAGDTDDNRYFKRLRVVSSNQIVLESLDSGGEYGPISLSFPGKGDNCLLRVWPVVGVLFEKPT